MPFPRMSSSINGAGGQARQRWCNIETAIKERLDLLDDLEPLWSLSVWSVHCGIALCLVECRCVYVLLGCQVTLFSHIIYCWEREETEQEAASCCCLSELDVWMYKCCWAPDIYILLIETATCMTFQCKQPANMTTFDQLASWWN